MFFKVNDGCFPCCAGFFKAYPFKPKYWPTSHFSLQYNYFIKHEDCKNEGHDHQKYYLMFDVQTNSSKLYYKKWMETSGEKMDFDAGA